MVGSEAVGDCDGEVEGSEVVGEVVGSKVVGDSVTVIRTLQWHTESKT